MIHDPYQVLGVSEQCSDQELKKAYRDLSKKYHPDANLSNPEAAAERFKEVQEAYRQIVDARERGTSAYGGTNTQGNYQGYGDFGAFGDFFNEWMRYQQSANQERTELQAARNYINNGYFREAMTALEQVAELEREARWYYYAAIASRGLGNNVNAMNFAKRAYDAEPENRDYQMLLHQLQNGGTWYTKRGESFGGYNPVSNTASWCLGMVALNLCCNIGLCC